jgi:hypothetical protein
MVRTLQWKYVYHELGGVEELYDEVEDPQELHNLAAERPEVVAELRGATARLGARERRPAHTRRVGDLVTSRRGPADLRLLQRRPHGLALVLNDRTLAGRR